MRPPSFSSTLPNIIGGCISLSSIAIPWFFIRSCSGFLPSFIFEASWVVPVLVVSGGMLALISRYGSLLTFIGAGVYALTFRYSPCVMTGVVGFSFGIWFSLAGAITSLFGRSWYVPRSITAHFPTAITPLFWNTAAITLAIVGSVLAFSPYWSIGVVCLAFALFMILNSIELILRKPKQNHNTTRLKRTTLGNSSPRSRGHRDQEI